MTPIAEKIFSDAVMLNESEREELAFKLMNTLDASVDAGYAEAWKEEIEARIADSEIGRAKSIPLDQAMRMIRGEDDHETS